jgi:hypothetical protein
VKTAALIATFASVAIVGYEVTRCWWYARRNRIQLREDVT